VIRHTQVFNSLKTCRPPIGISKFCFPLLNLPCSSWWRRAAISRRILQRRLIAVTWQLKRAKWHQRSPPHLH